MNNLTGNGYIASSRALHYTLRIASAMCFIGHGAFGIITKPIWCNYFAVFGIGHDLAYRLMPVLGTVDILMGLSLLIFPTRAILAWLVGWGIITALLRPISGEPFAEFIERAGNFGAPLALLILSGGGAGVRDWFSRIVPEGRDLSAAGYPDKEVFARLALFLRVIVFLLLLGHGWLNLIEKKGLLSQYQALGFSDPVRTALFAGLFEILAAVAILVRPAPMLLASLMVWKMGTELFYPHWELFEWVERGGSYGAILALWLVIRTNAWLLSPGPASDTKKKHLLI
jgi:hypothetical protein